MVTMLRSVGIPARFCTVIYTATTIKKTGTYIVRGKQAPRLGRSIFPWLWLDSGKTTPDTRRKYQQRYVIRTRHV